MILIRKTNKYKFLIQRNKLYTLYYVLNYEILVLRKHNALNVHKFEKVFRYLTHINVDDIMFLRKKRS